MSSVTIWALTATSLSLPLIRKASPKTANAVKAGIISYGKSLFMLRTGLPADVAELYLQSSKSAPEGIGAFFRKLFPTKSLK